MVIAAKRVRRRRYTLKWYHYSKRILLPVSPLQQWIEHNILLELTATPFPKDDAQFVPEAWSCVNYPKRTGHNTLLFPVILRSMHNQADAAKNLRDSPQTYKVDIGAIPATVKE